VLMQRIARDWVSTECKEPCIQYLFLFVNDADEAGLSETPNIAVFGYRDNILLQRIIIVYRLSYAGYSNIYTSVLNQQMHTGNICFNIC
jgi:hypothetical protein